MARQSREATQARRAAEEAQREERRQHVASRLLAGLSQRRIAAELGVDVSTISRDFSLLRQEWAKRNEAKVSQLVAQETARYDAALEAIWERVERGDDAAIHLLVKLSRARREILGLDAPTRVEQETTVKQSVSVEALESKFRSVLAARGLLRVAGEADAGGSR